MFVSRHLCWVIWSIVNTQQQLFTAMLYAQVVSLNGLSSLGTEQAQLRVYGTRISNLQEILALRKTLHEFKRENKCTSCYFKVYNTKSALFTNPQVLLSIQNHKRFCSSSSHINRYFHLTSAHCSMSVSFLSINPGLSRDFIPRQHRNSLFTHPIIRLIQLRTSWLGLPNVWFSFSMEDGTERKEGRGLEKGEQDRVKTRRGDRLTRKGRDQISFQGDSGDCDEVDIQRPCYFFSGPPELTRDEMIIQNTCSDSLIKTQKALPQLPSAVTRQTHADERLSREHLTKYLTETSDKCWCVLFLIDWLIYSTIKDDHFSHSWVV